MKLKHKKISNFSPYLGGLGRRDPREGGRRVDRGTGLAGLAGRRLLAPSAAENVSMAFLREKYLFLVGLGQISAIA